MTVTDDGYSVTYLPKENRISIGLPMTWETYTHTFHTYPIGERKVEMTDRDELILLAVVRAIFKEDKTAD